jgi:hypothetical protein
MRAKPFLILMGFATVLNIVIYAVMRAYSK